MQLRVGVPTAQHMLKTVKLTLLGIKIFFVKQAVRLLVNEQYDGVWNTRSKNKSKIIL